MEEKLEKLEMVVVDALRSHQEEQRRQQTLGLIPGEPVDGEELDRDQLEEFAA